MSARRAPAPEPIAVPALAAPLVVAAYRALACTWRFRFHERWRLEETLREGPAILAFWHGEQLPLVLAHAAPGILGVASRSRDGELLARVIARLGYGLIRGSSSRGGGEALRAGIRALREGSGSPALALDGPRGPWHEPRLGALALAALTGRPIVFAVSRCRPALRLGSWDRFVVPLPFARIDVAYGIFAPPVRDRASLERARGQLRQAMESLADSLSAVRGSTSPGR